MHLNTFTSVIALLIVQHPELSAQLQLLKTAIVEWYEGVQQQLRDKNRMLLAARARGNEKLFIVFEEVQCFFSNMMRSYSDPNLPVFYRKFLKIKQDFEFRDVDFLKFAPKPKEKQVQTDRENIYIYGVDMQKLVKSMQTRQNELENANYKIADMQNQNEKLRYEISLLMEQNKKESAENTDKIQQLMDLLHKAKIQSEKYESQRKQKQTQKKSYPMYRSNPQIGLSDFLPHKGIIKNLLQNAYYEQMRLAQHQNTVSLSQANHNDPEYLRVIFSQATALQGILQSLAQKQKAQQQ